MNVTIMPLSSHPNDPESRARQAMEHSRPSGITETKPITTNQLRQIVDISVMSSSHLNCIDIISDG